jgi:hypothetical protein
MLLAILEDRMGRLARMATFDLKKRPEIKIFAGGEFTHILAELRKGNTNMLQEFDSIAAHRSALKDEHLITQLETFCQNNKKNLILFSGSITSGVFRDQGYQFLLINSKDFYSANLELFLEDTIAGKKPNLLILQFGRRWKLSLLLYLRNHIVVFSNNNELIRVSDLAINSQIINDLTDDTTKALLTGNQYAAVSPDQMRSLRSRLDYVINTTV